MEITYYKNRRKKLLTMLPDGIAVIPSASEVTRSNSTNHTFRQNSNFKYLTGFNEPDAILVLCSQNDLARSILFLRPKNDFEEMWSGRRMGVEKAKELLEVDATYPIDKFDEIIPSLLSGHRRLYTNLFDHSPLLSKLLDQCHKLSQAKKRKSYYPYQMIDLAPYLGKLRLTKEPNEILAMKKAAEISSKAHRAAMAMAKPGLNESHIASLMEYIFKKEGASGPAYESIVASGDNANILHYISNNAPLNDGELLLIDAGAEFNLYASDVTRTFPISGKYSGRQKEVYELVLQSQKECIGMSSPGRTLSEIHQHASKVLTQGLVDMKILEGDLDELIATEKHRQYYPHGTGHWLGLDVHDQSPYLDDQLKEIVLAPGMAYTIEPGLYFPKSDSSLPEDLRGIGIRIEDDILIEESGHKNLSANIPKEIKEVEEACQQDHRDFLE